jgi:hypothetical protein
MNALITYKEISDFIERQYKIRPMFNTVDTQTVEVSYKPGAFIPAIVIKLKVDEISDDIVQLSYDCGKGASFVITGAVAYLEQKIPKVIEVNTADKHITVYLQQIKELEKVLEYVALNTVKFEGNSINFALIIL